MRGNRWKCSLRFTSQNERQYTRSALVTVSTAEDAEASRPPRRWAWPVERSPKDSARVLTFSTR